MYMFPFLLFIIFIGARMNTTYHPHLLFKKYVIIKNQTLAKLLIGQSDPVNSRAKNAKSNRNKLSYAGIVFYISFLFLVILSIVMFLIPDIPVESFTFDSKTMFLTGSTLNAKLPTVLAFALMFAEIAFHFINTSKYAVEKTSAKRFIQVLYYLFSGLWIIGMLVYLWMVFDTIISLI